MIPSALMQTWTSDEGLAGSKAQPETSRPSQAPKWPWMVFGEAKLRNLRIDRLNKLMRGRFRS
jgi:hypothetical protein